MVEGPYVEDEGHVGEVELALLLVVLLQLGGVVVLAFLGYVRAHVRLLFGLEHSNKNNSNNTNTGERSVYPIHVTRD